MTKDDAKEIFEKNGKVFPDINIYRNDVVGHFKFESFVRLMGKDGKYWLLYHKNEFKNLFGRNDFEDVKLNFINKCVLSINHYIISGSDHDISFLDPVQTFDRHG